MRNIWRGPVVDQSAGVVRIDHTGEEVRVEGAGEHREGAWLLCETLEDGRHVILWRELPEVQCKQA
jgi:hypothetical protein